MSIKGFRVKQGTDEHVEKYDYLSLENKPDLSGVMSPHGLNIFNPETLLTETFLNATTGDEEFSNFYWSSDFIPVNGTYTIKPFEYSGSAPRIRLYKYNSNRVFANRNVVDPASYPNGYTFTYSGYIRVAIANGGNGTYENPYKFFIAKGSESTGIAKEFVPYYTANDLKAREAINQWSNKGAISLTRFRDIRSITENGLTYSASNNVLNVDGTSTSSSFINIAGTSTSLPDGIERGGTYNIYYNTSTSMKCRVVSFKNSVGTNLYDSTTPGAFTVPLDSDGIVIRFFYLNGNVFNNDTIDFPVVSLLPSIIKLGNEIDEVNSEILKTSLNFDNKIETIRIEHGLNIFNPETLLTETFLNATTGDEEFSNHYWSSDFIPVSGTYTIKPFEYSGTTPRIRLYKYNSSKVFANCNVVDPASYPNGYTFTYSGYIRVAIANGGNGTYENPYKYFMAEGSQSTGIAKKFIPYYTANDLKAREAIDQLSAKGAINATRLRDIPTITENGLTYSASDGVLSVNGTSTTSSFINIAGNSPTAFPNGIERGGTYNIYYNTSTSMKCRVVSFKNNVGTNLYDSTTPGAFTVPLDSDGVVIRFFYLNGSVFNNDTIDFPVVSLLPSIIKLGNEIDDHEDRISRIEAGSGGSSTPPPLLSIIDDDGHLDYHDYLLPFCREVNAPIASAVTPLRFGSTNSSVGRYMTIEEIKECMSNGAEILCHAYSHTPNNADVRKTEVINGRYVSSTIFNDTSGNVLTGASDVVYHDVSNDRYYVFENGTFSTIPQNAAARYSDIISVFTDVSGYRFNGSVIYPDKESYYIDKLTKNYTTARNILLNNGMADGNIIVFNNNTGHELISQKAAERVFRCGFNVHGATINHYGRFNIHSIDRFPIETAAYGYYGVQQMKTLIDTCLDEGGWMIWTMHTTGNEWRGTTSGSRTGQGRDSVLSALRQAINYAHSVGLPIVTAAHGCKIYVDGKF